MAELDEIKAAVEAGSIQIDDIVKDLVQDMTKDLDEYIDRVRNLFLNSTEIPDRDLDRIILSIPSYTYQLTSVMQSLDIRKGVSAENAKFYENEQLIIATGNVAERTAKAANATIKNRIVQLAFKSATALIQTKINAALEIHSSAKKVQDRRKVEMQLTKQAGNSVGAF